MNFYIEAACGSSIGRVRENNEDNFFFDKAHLPQNNQGQYPPLNMYGDYSGDVCMAVFDGMGGGEHGEVASFSAAECVNNMQNTVVTEAEAFLEEVCLQANQRVWRARQELCASNMGTTLAMLYLQDDTAYIANVGDSRIFALRGDRMIQISVDHTDEAYMKKQGITGRRPRLTQYLGTDPGAIRIEPHITRGQMQTGDIYLICSDGLTDMVAKKEIQNILLTSGTATACVDSLISAALENGGRDNITVIVCRILESKVSLLDEAEKNENGDIFDETKQMLLTKKQQLLRHIQNKAKELWDRN